MRQHRTQAKENLKSLPLIENRVKTIEVDSPRFLGKTEKTCLDLKQSLLALRSTTDAATQLLDSLDHFVCSDHKKGWHRFKGYFSRLNYNESCELHDESSLARLIDIYKAEESFVLKKLEMLELALQGLPAFLIQASHDLDKISECISFISTHCQADGFFPLRNLQLRLIPSIEALLDESARLGITDPVSAYENPVKLAARQIQDAAMITERVSELRKSFFPCIRLAVRNLERNGINTILIDECYFAHSKALESLANFALLWPIGAKMQRITEQLDSTFSWIVRAQKISCTIERTALPNINKMEARIAAVQKTAANRIEMDPGLILGEGNFDPSVKLRQAQQVILMVKERCSRGQIDEAENDFALLDSMLKQVEWLLQIAEYVLEKGDAFAIEVTSRLNAVEKRLPQILSKFEGIIMKNSLDALELNSRFDVQLFSKNLLANRINGMDAKIREIALILKQSRKCYRFGNLFSTSFELQRAAARVNQMENWIHCFEEQASALERVESINPKVYADLRWRFRSLTTKADDIRCRQRTLSELCQLGKSLETIENSLSLSSQNPFSLSHKLGASRRKIGEIENMITVDQKWHGIATETIKHSARTLRAHSSLLREVEGSEVSRKLENWQERYKILRQQLEDLQGFIEAEHLDWDEAFVTSMSILIESSGQIFSIKDDGRWRSQDASNFITEAVQRFRNLLNWTNEYGVAIDREAGFALLDEATLALVSGNFEEARFKANLSKQKSESELNKAKALTKRALLKIEGEKRQLCDRIINLQPSGESIDVSPILGLQDYLSKRTVFGLGFSRNEMLVTAAEPTYKGLEAEVFLNSDEEIQAEALLQNTRTGLSDNKNAA